MIQPRQALDWAFFGHRWAPAPGGGPSWRVLTLALVALIGCKDEGEGETSGVSTRASLQGSKAPQAQDLCTMIQEGEFETVEEHTLGMGQHEPVVGRWTLSFDGTIVQFNNEDMWIKTRYECRNDVIRAQWAGADIEGRFDDKRGLLIWNGIEYRQVH